LSRRAASPRAGNELLIEDAAPERKQKWTAGMTEMQNVQDFSARASTMHLRESGVVRDQDPVRKEPR